MCIPSRKECCQHLLMANALPQQHTVSIIGGMRVIEHRRACLSSTSCPMDLSFGGMFNSGTNGIISEASCAAKAPKPGETWRRPK